MRRSLTERKWYWFFIIKLFSIGRDEFLGGLWMGMEWGEGMMDRGWVFLGWEGYKVFMVRNGEDW